MLDEAENQVHVFNIISGVGKLINYLYENV